MVGVFLLPELRGCAERPCDVQAIFWNLENKWFLMGWRHAVKPSSPKWLRPRQGVSFSALARAQHAPTKKKELLFHVFFVGYHHEVVATFGVAELQKNYCVWPARPPQFIKVTRKPVGKIPLNCFCLCWAGVFGWWWCTVASRADRQWSDNENHVSWFWLERFGLWLGSGSIWQPAGYVTKQVQQIGGYVSRVATLLACHQRKLIIIGK